MRKIAGLIVLLCFSVQVLSQNIISGKVTDRKGDAIAGANIYLKDTYLGASSDSLGNFSLNAEITGDSILVVSFIGYQNFELNLNNISTSDLKIVLSESSNNINAVTITAGSFDASDETKAVTMRPLDIVTTASGEGDIYGALNTLPGTQSVGEEGGIFVRGGEGYETKTYIDGMLVKSPYSSSMPDVPSRGKFSPFLFSGTMFSTGGYSAEYGQALSSALVLKTNALPPKDVSSVTLMSVGLGASHTKRWEKTSISANVNYTNLAPYYQVAKQDIDWEKAPEGWDASLLFRQKVGDEGMVKSFASFSKDNSTLNYPNIEQGGIDLIGLKSKNIYMNTVYNNMLSDKWQIMGGISYSFDNESIKINRNEVVTNENTYQARFKLTNFVSDALSVKYGVETIISDYKQDYFVAAEENTYRTSFNDEYLATFIEPEIKLSNWFAIRVGGRFEFSNLNSETSFQPRASLAAKLTTYSQVSFAYGTFHQAAQNDFRKFNSDLKAEKAEHYILNYQIVKKERTFRVEAYYKNYGNLTKYIALNFPEKESYSSTGTGFAKGVDIFWRDRGTFKNIDYYISYSFVDTERKYRNYPSMVQPGYTSTHNLSVVYKHWIAPINTQLGLTYSFTSGRPYNNPNEQGFMTGKTPEIHDLSANFSHLFNLFNRSAILHLSASNILGLSKIYNYRFPHVPDKNGQYQAYGVKPPAKRFFVLVFILSL
jgi:hypothetical protein